MSAIKTHKAQILLDANAILGEGPIWDSKKQLLFWVDIEGCKLHKHDPSSGKNKSWSFNEMIGAAVSTKNGNLLLAMEKGLASFDLVTEQLTKLEVLENSNPKIRFNDGKVGPNGNFWVGTMEKNCATNAGNFYRISPNFETSLEIEQTSISNGMAWSSDREKFFYIDSPTFSVQVFDFDAENGVISNGRILFKIPDEYGGPDGMCIDSEDTLWIAHWGGHCVRRWNPETGQVLEKIEVAAPHVTSCCFGGKDLKTLYITTAKSGLTDKQLQEFPQSGGLFVHETTVRGTGINYF